MGNLADFLNVSGGTLLDDETPGGLKPLSFKPEDSAIRLRRAAVAAKEMDAKRAAEAAAYAEQNRVDPQAAYAAITHAPQDHSLDKMLNDPKWQEVAKKTPRLAEFLSDPINHKIAENDIENLSGLEYTWARIKQFGESLPEGVGQQLAQRRQSNALFTFMMHTAEPDLFHVTKSDLKELEESNLVNSSYDLSAATYRRNATSRAGMATANAVTQMGGTIGYGLAGAAIGGGALALVGGSRGGIPGAVAGAGTGIKAGQTAGVFYDSFKMNSANDFREFASLKDEAGQPLNQRVAAYGAIVSGLLEAAMDTYVVGKITGAIAPGVAARIRQMGGSSKVVADLLKRPGFRAELLKYGKDVAKLAALEVGTEGAQRAVALVDRELLKQYSENNLGTAGFRSPSLFEPLTDDQGRTIEPSYLSQIGTEMKEAAWGMPGAIAIFRAPHTVTSIRRQQNITASQEELKALDEVNTLTGESDTRKASPEAFNRLMNLLGGKNASDAVHIDADAVTRLFQNEGIDPAQGVRETFGESLVQPYEEALALGQSFRVPTQQFATEIAGTEMYGKLRESGGIRIRPEGLTEADLKLIDFNSEAEVSKLEQLAADITSGKITETPVQQVYKDIQAQLKGLNRYDQATINAYASQQAAFFGTLAGRMKREGVTAQSLYEPYRLRIANEMPRIIQRVDRARFDERLDPLLEGVRSGKVPTEKEVRGPSLVDFILENGGLVDSGGDLAGMDANAGRVGKNAIVRKTGRSLDAMAEGAHESGYLKSRDIQELLDGIAGELRGQPVHSLANEDADLMAKRQQMLDLQEALGGLGLDIGQYSNAELRDLLFSAGQESRGEAGMLEQSEATDYIDPVVQADYEKRIDELFSGGKANRMGAVALQSSDVMALLGYDDFPVRVSESKIILGMENHPGMDVSAWANVPRWMQNPVAVFDSDSESGRLVFIAPELVSGRVVLIIVDPDQSMGSGEIHLLLNAYDKTSRTPVEQWVSKGHLRYIDTKKSPAFNDASGLQLPRVSHQLRGSAGIVKTGKDLYNLRKKKAGGKLYQFAGQSAETADQAALDKAKQRIAAGEDAEAVRKDTGWHTGVDGKWRFEISDADAKLTPAIKSLASGGYEARDIASVTYRKNEDGTYSLDLNPPNPKSTTEFVRLDSVPEDVARSVVPDEVFASMQRNEGETDYIGANMDDAKLIKMPFKFEGMNALPLDMVIDHPALFSAYPALRQVMVKVDPKAGIGGSLAEMADGTFVITVGGGQQQSTMLHEIQHAIQSYEGFATGGNIRDMGRRVIEARAEADDLSQRLQRIENEAGAEADLWVAKYPDLVNDALDYLRKQGMFDEGDNVRDAVKYAIHDRDPSYQSLTKQWRQAKEAAQQSPTESYRRLAGEVEARNTQSRADLNEAERNATSPQSTADVAERDQIVTFAKGLAEMAVEHGSGRPHDYVTFNGSRDIAAISADDVEKAAAVGVDIKPLPIRLANGQHNGPHKGFGLAHIVSEHGDEISQLGVSPELFVYSLLMTANQIWKKTDGKLVFFKTGKRQRMAVIELRERDGAYSVVTAYPVDGAKQNSFAADSRNGLIKLAVRDRNPSRPGNQQASLPEPLTGSRNATLNPALEPLADQANGKIIGLEGELYQSAQPFTAPIIEIDGITRPTTNSAGNPIHSTEAGLRNFWKWFGDSKIVDEQGRPLVVYHGSRSTEALTEFVVSKNEHSDTRLKRTKDGAYFTRNPDKAAVYAGQTGSTYPVYLKISNPKMIADAFGSVEVDAAQLKAEGFDGLWNPKGFPSDEIVAISKNQIKSSTDNNGEFSNDSNNILNQQAQGHLAWNAAREFTLTLTGKANFSTFLHESAHFYLEVYRDLVKQGDLPQQMQDDWQAITRYLAGYADKAIPEIRATLESLRQQQAKATEPADLRSLSVGIAAHEQALQLAETNGGDAFMQQVALNFGDNVQDEAVRAVLVTPFHEVWARSMEGYFLEGKAPSLELMGAFSRFKVWMKQIYGTLTGLNVKLTDEVREVMGRMFAMDDEIAEAKEMQNAKPLFASLAAAGITKAQYDAYLKIVAQADDQIEAEALAMMGSAEKQRLRQVAAKRDEVRNEVENELNRQKVQMLIHFLRTGNFRDGHDMGAYIHPMKLDRQTIIDRKGPEFLKALPKGMYRDASQATESERQWIVDPDGMAMLFGYSSGDEMLIELANERVTSETKRREAIEAETDARLRQYFPDVTTSGESADIAMKAVNHATRADVLAREAELLADKIGEKATPDKIIQAYAVQKITETPVFELQTGVYLRAVSKAANAAFAALGKGDYKTALLEKQRERVNFHLYREAMRAQEATSRATDYLGSFDKKNKRQTIGKAGGTEYALIAGQDVTFYPTQQEADAAKAKAGNPRAYVEQRSRFLDQIDNLRDLHEIGEHYTKGDLRAMESMELFIKQMQEEGGEAPLVESWMFRNIPWQRLSFGQYVALSSAIKSIEVQARNRHKLSQMQKGMAMEQITGDITDAIQATGDTHHQSESFNRTSLDIAGEALDGAVAIHAKAEFIMELLDGGPNGPMYQHFMKPAQAAEVLENDRIAEMRQAVAKIFSAYTLKESAKLGSHWGLTQEYVPELGESMSRESLLALALNWGNEYNRQSVIEGQVNKNPLWTAENVEKALNAHLTDKDWDVVEQVWTLVNSYWPEVKALEERVSGVAPEKVEASPFQLKSGRVMAGGYYPLFYVSWHAKQAMQDAKTMLSGGMIESGLGSRAMTKHGHTIERTNSGGKPVMLTLDGLDRHLTSVIHDLVYRELLGDWNRILNNAQVRDAITGAQGVAMYKQLQLWMRRIANDRQPMDTFVHAVFNRLNAGVSVVLLGLSLGNAMMQQSGYLLAVPTIGIRSVVQGMIRLWSNPFAIPRTLRFVQERSGFMRQRDITFSREVRDAMKDLNPADKATNVIRRTAFYLTAKSQMTVDMATWMGAYEKALRGDAGPNVARGHEADAIDYADAVVRKTQSGGSAKDLATIQGQNAMVKAVTPLYGYFSVLFNQFLLAKRQTRRAFREGEYRRGAERIIANTIFLWLAPMLLSELLAARGPDDDEEWKDWLKKKGADIAAYPFATVIGVNWFANYYAHPERGLGNMPSFGAMKTIADALASATDVVRQPFSDEDLLNHEDAENAALATGYAFSLPTKGIYNAIETFAMWANDEYQPQSLQETMRSIMRGVPKEAYAEE